MSGMPINEKAAAEKITAGKPAAEKITTGKPADEKITAGRLINNRPSYIRDSYPMKAQYISGEPVEIAAELINTTDGELHTELVCEVSYLAEIIETVRIERTLEPGGQTVIIPVKAFDTELMGFGTSIQLYAGGVFIDSCSGSFDVVSSWRKSPRYGFLSDFYPGDENDGVDVKSLCKLHINLIQFYDWMYRHDELVPPEPEFTDLMGRKVSRKAVEDKISFCHQYGMKAIAYGAVYAASKEFYESHIDWAFYNSSGDVFDFINIFRIMNISEECPWHWHIIGEYKKAIEKIGFDGIHMDTYGYPKAAISMFGGVKKTIRLEECFPVLISNTRRKLEETGRDICLIFNCVGNWPVEAVASAPQDAVYIEVWKPYERYHHIQQLILRAKELGGGKPVILAAYLKPFLEEQMTRRDIPTPEEGLIPDKKYFPDGKPSSEGQASSEEQASPTGQPLPNESQGTPSRAEASALLLTAAIAANGGYHMLLGEENGILTQGYYVDYSRLRDSFFNQIRRYYDFIIRYLNILFDNELKDVSMTHTDGDNREYVFENGDCSSCAEQGKVWIILRESKLFKTVSLINLCGNDDYWNRGKDRPVPVTNISVRIQIEGNIKNVFLASPDHNGGRPVKMGYRLEEDSRGRALAVCIPGLEYWSLLAVELEESE